MRRVGDVEIDAGDISITAAILMSLIEEVATVVEAGNRATGIVIENEIQVLIRLGFRGLDRLWRKIVEKTESRDRTGWVLDRSVSVDYNLQGNFGATTVAG